MTIERATLDDMPACAAIFNRWVDETPWMPRVHDTDDVTRHYCQTVPATCDVWIAFTLDGIVAFAAISSDGFVTALYADPAGRGLGVGKTLIDRAKKDRPLGLKLWTFAENIGARRFYAREGFVEIRRTDGDNEERLADILFEWRPEKAQ